MKIEVGKKYRTREGGTAEVRSIDGESRWPFQGLCIQVNGFRDAIASWTPDGRYSVDPGEGPHDLIAEIDGNGEPIEVGGCAPPVLVAAFSDEPLSPKMAERIEPVDIKPVEHAELPPQADRIMGFAEQIAQAFPPGDEAERPSGMAVRMVGDGVADAAVLIGTGPQLRDAERAINPPVFIDLTSGAVNAVGAPPAGQALSPEPSNRQLASALRLLVREADRYADDDLRLADAIVLAESVLDRRSP